MKKRINHSFTFFLSIFVFLFFSLSTVQAKTYVTSGWSFNYNWTCGGMETGAYFTMDGTKVFCVEPHIIYKPNQRYEVVSTRPSYISEAKAKKLSLISYYGTKYLKTERHYAATQSLIWMELGESESYSVFKVSGSSVKPEMNEILNLVNTHELTPSFSNQSYTLEVGKTLEIEDTNHVLNRFEIKSIDGIEITKKDNKLIITATENAPNSATIHLTNNADSNDGSTMYYKIPGTTEGNGWQICAKFYVDEAVSSLFNLNIVHYETPDIKEVQVKKNGYDEGNISVLKTDASTNQGLEAVAFSISMDGTMINDGVTTDENGQISVPFKKEYQAQSDFISYITNYESISPELQLTYKDLFKSYDEAYQYATNQAINRLNERISDASYTFIATEKMPRDGYYLSQNKATLTTKDNDIHLQLQNSHQTIEIELTKIDEETSLPIEGVIFGLYAKKDIIHPDGKTGILYSKDTLVSTFPKTDIHGKTYLQQLYLGDYYIKELESPLSYYTNQSIIDITYSKNNEAVILAQKTISNKKTKVDFIKLDSKTKQPLQGAHLQLMNQSGQIINQWISTDKPQSIEGLHRNETYTLVETKAPEGYLISKPLTFTIEDNNHKQTITMLDEYIYGKVCFNKVGEVFQSFETGFSIQPIEGSEISIYNSQDELISVLTSQSSMSLPYGQYYAIETKVPDGYIQDANKYEFDITSTDEIVLTIENKLPTFTLQLTKQFEDDAKFYSDVSFGIYTAQDLLVATCKLDENGQLVNVPKLPYGSYYLKELTTHANYTLDQTHYPFTLRYMGKDTDNITIAINDHNPIVNLLNRATLTIFKSNEFHHPLEGATFILMNENKEVIDQKLSDTNGKIYFENLILGTYYIQEKIAPEGYQINDEIIEITLNENYEISILNQSIPTTKTGDHQMILPLLFTCITSVGVMLFLKKKKGRSLL